MFSALKRPAVTRSMLRKSYQQNLRWIICDKPAKEKIGPVKSIFALCVFAVSLLAPAGWILYHIPEYRQRPPPQQ